MSNTENSALIALSALKDLEANRVADIEADKRAKEEATRRAREEAERKAREEAERLAKEEAERLARLAAEQEARDREERLRLQEAELRARAEQQARLQEEQMRLDAQVKLAEKKAKPVWLYVTIGVLVVGLGIGGYFANERFKRQDEEAKVAAAAQAEATRIAGEQKKAIDQLMGELKGLKDEQDRLEKEKKALDDRINTVTDAAEKARLEAEKRALEGKLDENKKKQTTKRGQTKPGGDDSKPEKSKGGITVKKNVDDPLDGL
jgi:colicin import membrane protein